MKEQTNKYLYKIEADTYATGEELEALEKNIDTVIDSKWSDALNTSGYIADCILKAKKFYTIKVETVIIEGNTEGENTSYNILVVGEDGATSTFFLPNGKNGAAPDFITKTYGGRIVYDTSDEDSNISSSKVVDKLSEL